MRLTVQPGGAVVVTAPYASPASEIDSFVAKHAGWLRRAIERMSRFKALPASGKRAYETHKEEARNLIRDRLEYWNAQYGYTYGRVAIKNTKRIWGSCSRKGNLNFSYALLFLPRELCDYIVVHELCHLKELNHSKDFWALVEEALPNYRALRAELRRYIPRR